jgi:hypothetical protein
MPSAGLNFALPPRLDLAASFSSAGFFLAAAARNLTLRAQEWEPVCEVVSVM